MRIFIFPGFEGDTCMDDINECLAKPCKNQGTCLNSIGSYTCKCSAKYTGPLCEEIVVIALMNSSFMQTLRHVYNKQKLWLLYTGLNAKEIAEYEWISLAFMDRCYLYRGGLYFLIEVPFESKCNISSPSARRSYFVLVEYKSWAHVVSKTPLRHQSVLLKV